MPSVLILSTNLKTTPTLPEALSDNTETLITSSKRTASLGGCTRHNNPTKKD